MAEGVRENITGMRADVAFSEMGGRRRREGRDQEILRRDLISPAPFLQ